MDPISDYTQSTPESPKAGRTLDKDAFLKLLTAQLQYQDPMNPSSQDQMFGTLSQMGMVEQVTNLNEKMANLVQDNNLNLIGREVSVQVEENKVVKGIVDAIVYEKDGPVMLINNQKLPVTHIIQVEQAS